MHVSMIWHSHSRNNKKNILEVCFWKGIHTLFLLNVQTFFLLKDHLIKAFDCHFSVMGVKKKILSVY